MVNNCTLKMFMDEFHKTNQQQSPVKGRNSSLSGSSSSTRRATNVIVATSRRDTKIVSSNKPTSSMNRIETLSNNKIGLSSSSNTIDTAISNNTIDTSPDRYSITSSYTSPNREGSGYDLSSVSSLLASSPQLSAAISKKFEKNSEILESILNSSISSSKKFTIDHSEKSFNSISLDQTSFSDDYQLTLSKAISTSKVLPEPIITEEKNISPIDKTETFKSQLPDTIKGHSDHRASSKLSSSSKVFPDPIDSFPSPSKVTSSSSTKIFPDPENVKRRVDEDLLEPIVIKAKNGGPDLQTYGISVKVLRNIVKGIKSKKVKGEGELLMTRDVTENFLSELTKHDDCSVCEYLLNYWTTIPHPILQNQHNDVKMVANLFIVHAWSCTFEHLVDAIETFVAHNPRDDGEEWSIWIDICSFNQSISLFHGPYCANRDWYQNTFSSLLKTIGHTLIIYLPWNNPVVLKRTWCLWEIYQSHVSKVKVSIQMSKKRHPAFLKLILEKFETALDVFNVDLTVDNSQASNNKCRSEIFVAMRMFCDDGLHGVNVAIKQSIRNWVVDTAITVLTTEIEKCQSSKMHAKMMSGKAIGPFDLLLHLFGCRTHKNHGAAYHEFLLQEFRLANYLGTLYTEKDYLSAAEKYFNHAMLIGRKFLRKNHAAILAIMSNLALICKRHNDYEKAEELYNFCLKEKNQELGSSHPSTLVTAFNLAVCIKHRGDSETALSMMLACLTDQEVELGLDHPDTMHTLENVASILLELKRNAEAHRLLQKSVDYRIKRYGPSHHETVTILETVAELYAHEHDMNEAINVYQEVLETKRSSLGHAHPSTLMTCERLAAIYKVEKEYEKSLKLYEFVYAFQKTAFGEKHRIPLDILSKVAEVYSKLDNHVKGEELFRKVLGSSRVHLGADDDITLNAEYHLANILLVLERYDEALELHQRGSTRRSALLGPKHLNSLLSTYGYSVSLVYKKRFVDSYPLLEECLKGFDEVVGPENDHSLKVAETFATVCKVIGDFKSCDVLYNRLVQSYMKLHGADHPLSIQAVRNLSTILQGPRR